MCSSPYLVPLLLAVVAVMAPIPGAELVSVPVAVPIPVAQQLTPAAQQLTPVAQPLSDNFVLMSVAKQSKPDCPYCDSSVFPYCSDKLLHDACCCQNPQEGLPPQCQLADCSFLHANSCKEHRLITRCCCTRLLYIKR